MFRAELLKLRTVSSTWVALAVGVIGLLVTQVLLVTLLPAMANGSVFADEPGLRDELGTIDTASHAFQYSALNLLGTGGSGGSIGIAMMAVLALGLLVGTTDYRHGGIVGAALARPRRVPVLTGKIAATSAVAGVLGVVLAAVSIVVLLLVVWTTPATLAVQVVDIASSAARGILVVVLLALLGLGIGVLVRSQLAAFLTVGALLIGEPMLQGLVQLFTGGLPTWALFMPVSLSHLGMADPGDAILSPVLALGALAALTALVLVAATAALRRRDL
jgi:ABC-2 type transport system permease protein